MLFDTLGYWVFFALTLVLLWSLRDRPAKLALVVLSYVFYGAWDWRFCALLALSTVVNFAFGRWIEAREGSARKWALASTVIFNLGLLSYFKYCNFFIQSLAAMFALDEQGLLLNIVLPVGISFITFEGIAYATDVYRRQLPAVRDPVDFALFISFFPHLVAGPIIRPMDFFPQLAQRPALTSEDSRWGLREILKGLIKKIAFANYFAPIADAAFQGTPHAGMAVPMWAGVLAFSMQIYFDFSGYTDIARGCARLLGYRFPPNFERPYLSTNVTEFWRRWHISLSFWLRDYLYISLGGNRRGPARTYLNLMIVMALGGLWHGASWNFAIWGIYHGVLLIAHRGWCRAIDGLGLTGIVAHPSLRPLWIASTFLWVSLGWVPFRAADLSATLKALGDLFVQPGIDFAAANWGLWLIPVGSLLWCLLDRDRRLQNWMVQRARFGVVVAIAALALLFLEVFGQYDTQIPFVYFQF